MEELKELYATVQSRQTSAQEGSYTGYLFAQGLDKILKKILYKGPPLRVLALAKSLGPPLFFLSALARNPLIKAALFPCMAGRALGLYPYQQCIVIAVRRNAYHPLGVS